MTEQSSPGPGSLASTPSFGRLVRVGVAIVALTCAAFLPLAGNGFIDFDDDVYVTENRHVRDGLSAGGLVWALSLSGYANNWHPLTWVSHMIDIELFGLNPRGHHLVSLLLHAAAAALLFLVCARMTGALWPSAAVAALFAVHPLHVESVAWQSERKDVLCGLLWMVALGAYLRYVRRPGVSRYLLLAGAFAAALLAKPMAITLPFVLLLLDWWPFGRLSQGPDAAARRPTWLHPAVEKLPLVLLAAGSGTLTYLAQGRGGVVGTLNLYPLGLRIANAVYSYAAYGGQMLWPANLAVFYPYPVDGLPAGKVAAAALLVAVVTALALVAARRHPWLPVGWFWYLGTLVPVIGLVQVGLQARADRYTYLPLVGLFIAAVWGSAAALRERVSRAQLAVAATVILAILAVGTALQARRWRDPAALYAHAAAAVPGNWWAHNNLGKALIEQGDREAGVAEYLTALTIDPRHPEPYSNLGNALVATGRFGEAVVRFGQALRIRPDFEDAHVNLANTLARMGRLPEAIDHYRTAIAIRPDSVAARNNLGMMLLSVGQADEALLHFQEAVRLQPDDPRARRNLERALRSRR